MASRSLFTCVAQRSCLVLRSRLTLELSGRSLHSVSGLASDKSAKDGLAKGETGTTWWTQKQHDEWVDRMFGPLKKRSHNKTDDKTKGSAKKSP